MRTDGRRIITVMLTFILSASIFSIFWVQIPQVRAQDGASLTGVIYDEGVDTDGNGAFDYLKIGVEVNVTESGFYEVDAWGLLDASYNYISVGDYEWLYLDAGVWLVNLTFDGPTIYLSGLNPTNVSDVSLYDEDYYILDSFSNAPLSREYFYYEFDIPDAMLTGVISDQGVDTDGDGTFDYLEVGVEVNVTASAMFRVRVSGLYDSTLFNYISISDESLTYLDVGVQMVYVSLDGPTIYASGLNPFYVSSIYIYDENHNRLDYLSNVPLSREYLYTEFDLPPAFLTGYISDGGVDTDADGTFDYLRVGVEVNVTASGMFRMEVWGLYDSTYNYISISNESLTYLDVGIQIVYLSLDGPTIYASGLNPLYVSDIDLYDENYNRLDSLSDVPLSREYSYTEFDLPPAFLTGNISDGGVDTDADGTFDYLRVGVEVNVTASGMFRVRVSGLYDSTYDYISVWDENLTYLDVGIQIVYLSLDGPTIYASGLNPVYVSSIYIYDENYNRLDYLDDAPLSREYFYYEFDLPDAMLTSLISDQGVDTDGDGTFDYLRVGVEVNVTASGMFRVEVSGLYDSTYDYISVWDENFTYLDVGVQMVYLSLDGPTIYASGLNPLYVSDIDLYDENYNRLDSLDDVPLSREYSYTEFDAPPAPFTDAEVKFIVYPDGRVVIKGALNQTNMVPEYTGPTIYGGINFTEGGASADLTLIVPPEMASEFPFNSTTVDLFGEYLDGLLDVGINATIILPSSLASEFPFNVTDLTMNGEYSPNQLSGTVTLHMLSGFPLGDVDIDFNGNLTDISFNGSANVIYGIYNGLELNETSLPQLLDQINSTIPGRGDESLYNMTDGMFEVTRIDYTVTPYAEGAIVDFKVYIHGDIVQALTTIITPPGEDPDPIYSLLNSTFYSVESASIQLAYAHAQKEASIELAFVVDADGLWEDIVSLLPEIVPPENRTLVDLLLNTTFCSVESGEFSLSYSEGKADLKATVAIEGDLNAELNYLKSTLLTYAVPQPLPWQVQFINDTQIDVSNLEISLDISEVAYLINLEGLAVLPPIDVINATSFKLERFFNLTTDMPFPGEGERLKVTVEGSNNATHEVKLFRPETVPEPNVTDADNKLMVWYNQSLSDLKDLIFIVQLDTTNPIADAGPDQTVKVGTTVNFDASNSTDNLVIASYEWDFGDGTTGTGMTTNHTYTEPGTYTVTLTVKDAAGNSDTDTLIVTVEAAPAFPWWIVVVIVVAIIAAAVALILWKRRAQKGGKTLQSASFLLIIF